MQTYRPSRGNKDVNGFSVFSTLKNIIQMGYFMGSINFLGRSVVPQ